MDKRTDNNLSPPALPVANNGDEDMELEDSTSTDSAATGTPSLRETLTDVPHSYPLRTRLQERTSGLAPAAPVQRDSFPDEAELIREPDNRWFYPPAFFSGLGLAKFSDLQEARQSLVTSNNTHVADSPISGHGVFASKDFKENELIGFYEGAYLVRKRLPSHWVDDYLKETGLTDAHITRPLYVVWSENDGHAEYFTEDDHFVSWTRVKIDGFNEEVGVNGASGGGNLSYLNHSASANVVLIPGAGPGYRVRQTANKTMYIKRSALEQNGLLVAAVALRDIPKNSELHINYGTNPDFTVVGKDIIRFPGVCSQYHRGRMYLVAPNASLPSSISGTAEEEPGEELVAISGDKLLTSPEAEISEFGEPSGSGGALSLPLTTRKRSSTAETTHLQPKPKKQAFSQKPWQQPTAKSTQTTIMEIIDEYLDAARTGKLKATRDNIEKGGKKGPKKGFRPGFKPGIKDLAHQLNISPATRYLSGTPWDDASTYEFLEERGLLSDANGLSELPLSVLAERNKQPKQYPNLLESFIIQWFEDGGERRYLLNALNLYGIQPPEKFLTNKWTGEILESYKTRCDPEKMYQASLEKIKREDITKKHSMALGYLLKIDSDAALTDYLRGHFLEKKSQISTIRMLLNSHGRPNPVSKGKEWSILDIVRYMIDHGVLDLDNEEHFNLLPVDVAADIIQGMDNSELLKARYVKGLLASGKSINIIALHGRELVGELREGERILEKIPELLMTHFPGEKIFKHSIDQTCHEIYHLRTAKPPKSAKKQEQEILLRLRLREQGVLEAYVKMRRNIADALNPDRARERKASNFPKRDAMLNKIALTFREMNIPVPPEYLTAQQEVLARQPSGSLNTVYRWKANNLRIILGEPLAKFDSDNNE